MMAAQEFPAEIEKPLCGVGEKEEDVAATAAAAAAAATVVVVAVGE